MNPGTWIAFGGLVLSILVSGGTVFWILVTRIDKTEGKLAAMIGKSDLSFVQFKEQAEREYLRKGEYEIAQKNSDRRLESIETKVDKIPESLDRQSERLIAVLREMRN